MFSSSQFVRHQLGERAAQSQVEQGGISNQCPDEREYSKAVSAQPLDEQRNTDGSHAHWRDTTGQIPKGIPNQQSAAGEMRVIIRSSRAHYGRFDFSGDV